jgi:hypothetical protein
MNGQEKDDEVYGAGNLSSAQFWEYDTRLGKRWNTDPIVKPWESHYATFGNNPIYYSDPYGLDKGTATKAEKANGGSDSKGTTYSSDGNTRTNGSTTQTLDKGCDCYINSTIATAQTTQPSSSPSENSSSADAMETLKQNTSVTITHLDDKKTIMELPKEYQGWGDKYEVTVQASVQYGQQKMFNVNQSVDKDGIPMKRDISLNIGPLRVKFDPNGSGSLTSSIGIGNYRFGYGVSSDGIGTISTTYRAPNGFGIQSNFSYRAGGGTALVIIAAALAPEGAAAAALIEESGAAIPVLIRAYKSSPKTVIIP